MFFDYDAYTYYVKPGFTDMRCGSDALTRIVMMDNSLNVYTKSMFLFLSKSKRTLAVLVWDKNGFWLMKKKLNGGTFPWPKDGEAALSFTVDDIKRLLSGNDIFRKLPELPRGMIF